MTFYIFMKKSLAKCDCSGYNRIVELTKMCWQGLWYYQYHKIPLYRLSTPAIHNCFFELQRRHNYYITFALFLQGLFCGCVAALWKDFSIRVWVLVCLCAYFLLSWQPIIKGHGFSLSVSYLSTSFYFPHCPFGCWLAKTLLGGCF